MATRQLTGNQYVIVRELKNTLDKLKYQPEPVAPSKTPIAIPERRKSELEIEVEEIAKKYNL